MKQNALTEEMLWGGYNRVYAGDNSDRQHGGLIRSLPCACGGFIEPPRDDHVGIEIAVRAHQGAWQHRVWRYDRGL